MRIFAILALLSALASVGLPQRLGAQEAVGLPLFFDTGQRLEAPPRERLRPIRFLTAADHPPFNFLDENDRLRGFNIDLAGAICAELRLSCTIQSYPFVDLIDALNGDKGDVIMAGIEITRSYRDILDFSYAYMKFPGRFVVLKSSPLQSALPETLANRTIGVVSGSAHEAYLRAFFDDARIAPFETAHAQRQALAAGEIEALFDDGMRLAFWLNANASKNCCRFVGGPYLSMKYFGEGMAAAMRKGDGPALQAINYALQRLYDTGKMGELYLRYFPVGFF